MKYIFDTEKFPPEILDYFNLKFPADLWDLRENTFTASITDFEWQLNCPFWKTKKGYSFNLSPMEVILSSDEYKDHYQRILDADTSYPVVVSAFEGKHVILDGLHRLSKLYLQGADLLVCDFVPVDRLRRHGQNEPDHFPSVSQP